MILSGFANPGFGVDGAHQMIVQIAALRHAGEESPEFERIGASDFERACGAEFAACLRCKASMSLCPGGCGEDGCKGKKQAKAGTTRDRRSEHSKCPLNKYAKTSPQL